MQKPASFLKKLLKNEYLTVFSFDMVAKVLMAVATIFIIRVLSTDEYASFTKFQSVSNLLFSIVGSGISVAYVRFAAEKISRGEQNSRALFNTCILFIGVLTLISLALTPLLRSLYGISALVSVLSLVYGGTLALSKMNQSYFQAEEHYRLSGVVTNIKNITLCLTVILVYLAVGHVSDIHIMALVLLSGVVACFLGYFFILKKNSGTKNAGNRETLDYVLFRDLFKESRWLVVYFLLVALFDQGCVAIMSQIASDEVIASYGVASKYYALMLTFLASLTTVLRIKTSNKDIVDSAAAQKAFTIGWIKKVWWIAAAVCAAAIGAAYFVLPLLNGDGYDSAIPAFQVLMVGVFISYVFAPNVAVMMSAKKHKLLCALAFLSFAINCAICYLFIPHFGAVAAAAAVVVSNGVLNVISTLCILLARDKKLAG